MSKWICSPVWQATARLSKNLSFSTRKFYGALSRCSWHLAHTCAAGALSYQELIIVQHQIVEATLVPKKQTKLRFRDSVFLAWGWCCAYCGKMLSQHDATLDHIHPRHAGGLTERKNLVACCFACNSHKSGREWKEWYKSRDYYSECRERWIDEWMDQWLHSVNVLDPISVTAFYKVECVALIS